MTTQTINKTQEKEKSEYVEEIARWLRKLGGKIKTNDKKTIPGEILDIVDHQHKVAIEFSKSFENSEYKLGPEGKKIHANKAKLCRDHGYQLIHIYEHTYLNRQQQIKSFVRSAFHLNERTIPARKCKITHQPTRDFLNEYHIQGAPSSVIKYFNIEYKGEVLGVMTASKHHEKGGDITACIISRLAFKEGVTVQGGSSKIFTSLAKWAKENGYETIISWSDNSLSAGGVYNKMGFELEDEHAPSYFYLDKESGVYKTKQSQRKTNKLRPAGMNIREWNNSRGVYAIWDCGKRKWVYHLNKKNHNKEKKINNLIKTVRDNLTFDLVKEEHRGRTPIHGSCYVASECIYYILKDDGVKTNIKRHKMPNGVNHWWLEKEDDTVIDPTYDQFPYRVPYELGKNASFLTKVPSKRTKILIEKVKEYLK